MSERTSTAGTSETTHVPTSETAASEPAYVKPPLAELRQKLTPIQFQVTQHDATEPPFRNAFWDHHSDGIYVDVVTGEPLFSSLDKFDSGTGWPSFSQPIESERVTSKTDRSHGMARTEVRSSAGSSHLGHVFDDGPAPTGLRYCINSAALRFVPADRLAAEGYGAYASRFSSDAEKSAPAGDVPANACANPPPGEQPGCEATLETVFFGGNSSVGPALLAVPGVLDVEVDRVDRIDGVRVVFDPKQIDYAHLRDRWAAATKGGAR